MKAFFKYTGIVFGILVLIAIVALIILVTFVSPNRFKPLITEEVKKFTGRELTIDGDLSWTLFPTLGVKVGHLELSNPFGFKEKKFAEIQSATVSVKVLPLFSGNVQSSGVMIKGLRLHLIKDANGKTNWQDLSSASSSVPAQTQPSVPASQARKAALGLAISAIDLSNAMVSLVNEQTKQTLDIDKLDIQAKDISVTKPFPFEASFTFTGKNPEMMGSFALKSNMAMNLEKQLYLFSDAQLSLKINKDNKNIQIVIKGNIAADMIRKKLQLDNLRANLANLNLDGKMIVADFTTEPQLSGQVHIQPFDVRQWLQAIGQDVGKLQTFKNLSGDFDISGAATLPSLVVKGTAKIDEIKASKIGLSNINVQTQLQKGVLTLSPMTASFYQGSIDGQAHVNLMSTTPQISLQAKLMNVQTEALLDDLAKDQKFKLAGNGSITLDVKTSGSNGDEVVKNLNGTAKIDFNNGVIKGIDIAYLIDSAIALANKEALPTTNTEQTQFGTLTATATIHDGVISNKDLAINSPRFDTKGEGNINLVKQQINYHLETTVKQGADQKNNLTNLYGFAIPIDIKGSLNNPNIHLDMEGFMKAIAQQQLKKAQTKIEERIKGKIPGKAGEFLNNLLKQ
ncbi:MAG: AsmA family protein [Gammaproteobacteria bacterium]